MTTRNLTCAAVMAATLGGCEAPTSVAVVPPSGVDPQVAIVAPAERSSLRFTLDGVEWIADQDLFGAVNPTGYDRAVLIAGSNGPKDANEQAFNLNLFGVDGPGVFTVHGDSPLGNAVQLMNLSPERFLIGGPMGFDLQVTLHRVDRSPVWIEASFQGTVNANDGSVLALRDGVFRYRE